MVVERKDLGDTIGYLLSCTTPMRWPTVPRRPARGRGLPQGGALAGAALYAEAIESTDVTPYDLVRRVRDTNRASVPTAAEQAFEGPIGAHGDHEFGDDPAIVGGIARRAGVP